ncbi:MAG: hypothetical protein NTY34_01560, partial [Candidatus Omnitrophica bacterium]|nr:hypothetical protein [Candidatus Omnitrophota bacterium]
MPEIKIVIVTKGQRAKGQAKGQAKGPKVTVTIRDTHFMIEEIESNIPPHLLFKELQSSPYSFFLDSVIGREKLGRFS